MKYFISFVILFLLCSSCSELKYSKIDQNKFVRYYYAQNPTFSKALFLYNFEEADSLAKTPAEKSLAKILAATLNNKPFDAYAIAKDINQKYKNDTIEYYTNNFIHIFETSSFLKDMYSSYCTGKIDSSKIIKVFPPAITELVKSDTIPFELIMGLPVVKVKIKQKEYSMIWDCGTSTSTCHFDTNDVKMYDGEFITTFAYSGDTLRNRPAFTNDFTFGAISIKDLFISYSKVKNMISSNRTVDGIIGWDIIQHFDNIIDFEHNRIILSKIDAATTKRSKYVNFLCYDRPVFLVYSLSGVPLYFHYDSGCNSSFVNNDYLKTLKIDSNALTSKKKYYTKVSNGDTEEYIYKCIPHLDFVLFDDHICLKKEISINNDNIATFLTHGRIGNDCFYGKALHFNISEGIFEVLD